MQELRFNCRGNIDFTLDSSFLVTLMNNTGKTNGILREIYEFGHKRCFFFLYNIVLYCLFTKILSLYAFYEICIC